MAYCYPDPNRDYPEREWKVWEVFSKATGFVGTVRAPRKALAAFHAEREFCLRAGSYYLGRA
ncbi:hypothetical protein MPPM_4728 [Methylorubrum populi]|uniref:Uncharacterized protein n=1 Tax=Methylorubrum populi TaxID=223967 RepID=A0A160PL06_9HYPH|nr:hypothetical protein [Methylorubrum populi]BAU93333.1 hypothetical protein MPPM_4728 [Methylorubrum populi]